MGQEIERKFLVASDGWRDGEPGVRLRQGYLTRGVETTVRVRLAGDTATLTVKGPVAAGARPEFEYGIPASDAEALLALCPDGVIDKIRYERAWHGHTWEIDVFAGANAGLEVAEVELDTVDEVVELPPWVGAEVTDDPRYLNASLARHPFRDW